MAQATVRCHEFRKRLPSSTRSGSGSRDDAQPLYSSPGPLVHTRQSVLRLPDFDLVLHIPEFVFLHIWEATIFIYFVIFLSNQCTSEI
jgi:hypothetical protein